MTTHNVFKPLHGEFVQPDDRCAGAERGRNHVAGCLLAFRLYAEPRGVHPVRASLTRVGQHMRTTGEKDSHNTRAGLYFCFVRYFN